jgi:hypothetical protein
MKRKMIILISLLLANITVQAAEALPQGRWKVEQVTIEKNTDGNIQTTVYNAADEVKSYISCPQEWEINEKSIVVRYPNGDEVLSLYVVDNGQLIMQTDDGVMPPYRYNINGKNITLTTTYSYVHNLPAGETERINEKWIVTLKKQKQNINR